MIFFSENKYRAGRSHAEYAQYWRENLTRLLKIALRLSDGMLPDEFFEKIDDPVELHDARIRTFNANETEIEIQLHGDDSGSLRVIEIRYDCTGLPTPDIPTSLLKNKPDCDLTCHEFIHRDNYFEHHMLFANGTEILIQFNSLVANFTPDGVT